MVTLVNKDLYINKLDSNYRGCDEMPAHQGRRTVLFTIIVTFSLLFPAFLLTPVTQAETAQGETTFYFHQFDLASGEGILDQNLPAKENDSVAGGH